MLSCGLNEIMNIKMLAQSLKNDKVRYYSCSVINNYLIR